MDSEQRKKIQTEIRKLYEKREMYLSCGDTEKFYSTTSEIAALERELRKVTDRKE